jgi:hypothetical protein
MAENSSKPIVPPFGGYIHWTDPKTDPKICQTCRAVLDVNSKFSLTPEQPTLARLELTPQDGHYLLKITQME